MLSSDFKLIESILWIRGYQLLQLHIERLAKSALFWDFKFSLQSFQSALAKNVLKLNIDYRYKVRVLLDKNADIYIENHIVQDFTTQPLVAFSDKTVDSSDIFLYHKTTNRILYDAEFAKASSQGLADVIFTNEKGEVTEGAISNIFIEKDGCLYTPPISCGLLDGVYRKHLLKTRRNVFEQVLKKTDILNADKVFISNAIRGLREVKIEYTLDN